MSRCILLTAAILLWFTGASAFAQEPLVYPAKGQNQNQMEKDKYQCYGWAKQQTGFDPMQPPAQQQMSSAPRSSALRGAAGGAALGAVGGAIGGDTGKGAAIGAATGGVVGGVRMRRERQAEAQAQQQQVAAASQARGGYDRAFGACMEGRGYTVK